MPARRQRKPFTPVVLAKFGSADHVGPEVEAGHDATPRSRRPTGDVRKEATLDHPRGHDRRHVYVQIANKGDTDGAYDDITLSFTARRNAADEEPPVARAARTSQPRRIRAQRRVVRQRPDTHLDRCRASFASRSPRWSPRRPSSARASGEVAGAARLPWGSAVLPSLAVSPLSRSHHRPARAS